MFIADTITLRADQLRRLRDAGIPAVQFVGNRGQAFTSRSAKATKENAAALANLLSTDAPMYSVVVVTPEFLFPELEPSTGSELDRSGGHRGSASPHHQTESLLMDAIRRLQSRVRLTGVPLRVTYLLFY